MNSLKQNEDNTFKDFGKFHLMVLVLSLVLELALCLKLLNLVFIHMKSDLSSLQNNEAEYEALIQGLTLALQIKVNNLVVIGDSELVINHIRKKYNIKKED
jgi:hypothetical protein